jgi:hypothetical protein
MSLSYCKVEWRKTQVAEGQTAVRLSFQTFKPNSNKAML